MSDSPEVFNTEDDEDTDNEGVSAVWVPLSFQFLCQCLVGRSARVIHSNTSCTSHFPFKIVDVKVQRFMNFSFHVFVQSENGCWFSQNVVEVLT